jgi:hypothetical protein
VETPPILDGVLDDPAWQEAASVEDFHIVVSDEFGKPGERSRVYLAFDADNLYFAARFWDSKPDTIVAKVLSKRDASFGEDGFSITLDPFDQARAGYMFDVNPNGMRSEAIYTDTDRQNWDWEGIWNAAARIDGAGWTAEVAIPVKTLSFDPASDSWGVNFTRWHGADNEQFGWVSYNRAQNLSRTGSMTGIADLNQGHGLDVVPGLRVGATRDYATDEEDEFVEPSLDAFWKITPSLTAALTLNPDFSGTTADTRQINLTRFDLFFPEQRAFFLQDSDIFEFGGLQEESGIPFFSRRIGLDDEGETLTLDAGLKLTGRAGPLNVGVLGVRQDAAVGPGSVGSLRRARRRERVRGIERRRHRDERQSRPACRQLARGRRLPLPQYAPGRGPQHRGDGLVPAHRHRRALGRRLGVRVRFRRAEQRGLERRARPQGDRGELFPRAGFRRPDRFRGDLRRARLHLAAGEPLDPTR